MAGVAGRLVRRPSLGTDPGSTRSASRHLVECRRGNRRDLPSTERLLTLRFLTVVASGLFYFVSLGMLLPVVPKFVEGPLGGSDLAVGVAGRLVLASARCSCGRSPVASATAWGGRVLIIGGAFIVAVVRRRLPVVDSSARAALARVFGGIGEAAFFVGAGIDGHRPRSRVPSWRGDQLLVGRGLRRSRVRSRARRARARRRPLRPGLARLAPAVALLAGVIALFTRETVDRAPAHAR